MVFGVDMRFRWGFWRIKDDGPIRLSAIAWFFIVDDYPVSSGALADWRSSNPGVPRIGLSASLQPADMAGGR